MKTDCKIIKDLMPVYCDEICSEESRCLVDEHLSECDSCKKDLELMTSSLEINKENNKEADFAKNASTAWKKGKKKAFFKGCIVVALIVCIGFGIYAGYHFFTSAGNNDFRTMISQAEKCFGYDYLVTSVIEKRGNYMVILLTDKEDNYCMCVYERDELFENRWVASGGLPKVRKGELVTWNYGSPQGEAVLVLCGVDLSYDIKQYSFENRGITYICPITSHKTNLDLFVIPGGGNNINTNSLTVE